MVAHKYICRDGDMVDAICFEHYGRHATDVMSAVYGYPENRGLRDAGQKLKAGDVVWLPEMPSGNERQVTRLWDEVDA